MSCDKEQPKNLYVAITSDRGLAGGVHSSICKAIRADLQEMTPEAAANTKVICVGDKSRAFMARYFPKNLIMVGSEIGRLPPQVCPSSYLPPPTIKFFVQFGDAAAVANAILNSGVDYDQGKMMYNKYKSVVSYDTTAIPLFSQGRFVILQDTLGQHFPPHRSFSSYLRGCDGRREDNCLRLCGR